MAFVKYFDALQTNSTHVYCNNAGGSQIPLQVIDHMVHYLHESHVQLDCVNKIGYEARTKCEEAKSFVDMLFNNKVGKIEFGHSTTQLATNLSYALPCTLYNEVIFCECLHFSMITPFEPNAKKVKWWRPHKYSFQYNDLFNLVNQNTSMVILPHVSNITGVVFDIKYIVEQIRFINRNVIIMVDGVSFLPHDVIDVDCWGVDYYFVSFYKFMGPHIAAVYMKDDSQVSSLNHYFVNDHKLELGSFPNEHLVGLLGIKDYMLDVSQQDYISRSCINIFYEQVRTIEYKILDKCDEYIGNMNQFEIVTDNSEFIRRFPIFSLTSKKDHVENINLFLNELDIMTSCGKFHCNKFLNENVLRLSFLHYNTVNEVDHVFDKLLEFNKSSTPQQGLMQIIFGISGDLFSEHYLGLTHTFKEKYNELSLDSNYKNARYRRYSLISVDDMKIAGTNFYQSRDYNKTPLGGTIRQYNAINICEESCFRNIIEYFKTVVKKMSGQDCRYCTIHQIRVEVNNDSVTPVPEGIHQDGYSYVGILCVNRTNISGGINKIYTLEDNEMYSTLLKEGEMIIFNDRQVKHYVSNIIRIHNEEVAYRDILVITTVF
jgi:selenocysteine lyase/cysteine desulfurase